MRILQQVIASPSSEDGDGVKIQRLAGRPLHDVLNPFLMVDEIHSDDAADYIGGFPEHPHRGFETITYMKVGRMRHRDHMGNEGVIGAGDVQWMTAGAGVLHSEMPEQEQGLLHGFQIWLNLPAAQKMKPAAYRDIASDSIAAQKLPGGGMLRAIAGDVTVSQNKLQGFMADASTQPVFLDVQLSANEAEKLDFNRDNPAHVYVYKGETDSILARQLGVYGPGDSLELKAGDAGAQLLVLSGRPIDEPIVQYGPFVMNTMEEIDQALKDFQSREFLEGLSAKQHDQIPPIRNPVLD